MNNNMICAGCNSIINDKDAMFYNQKEGKYFCQRCGSHGKPYKHTVQTKALSLMEGGEITGFELTENRITLYREGSIIALLDWDTFLNIY
jgi:hypothetical protein